MEVKRGKTKYHHAYRHIRARPGRKQGECIHPYIPEGIRTLRSYCRRKSKWITGSKKNKELMKDEAFVKELFAKTNAEDARTCFAEHGIEISPEEINQITETLKKVRSGEISPESLTNASACKLSDDELDQVSGGIVPIVVLGAVVVAGVAAAAYLGNEIYERGKEAEKAREQSTPGD